MISAASIAQGFFIFQSGEAALYKIVKRFYNQRLPKGIMPVGSLAHGLDGHLHEKKRLADIGKSKRNAKKECLEIRRSFKRLFEYSLPAIENMGKDMLTWVNQMPLTERELHNVHNFTFFRLSPAFQ